MYCRPALNAHYLWAFSVFSLLTQMVFLSGIFALQQFLDSGHSLFPNAIRAGHHFHGFQPSVVRPRREGKSLQADDGDCRQDSWG